LAEEQKRKIRISAGAFKAIFYYIELLNVFKYGRYPFNTFLIDFLDGLFVQ
jgi:hypothetical protein